MFNKVIEWSRRALLEEEEGMFLISTTEEPPFFYKHVSRYIYLTNQTWGSKIWTRHRPYLKYPNELDSSLTYILMCTEPPNIPVGCFQQDDYPNSRVRCMTVDQLTSLSQQSVVLFMLPLAPLTLLRHPHGNSSRMVLLRKPPRSLASSPVANVMVTDTGLDYDHCAFYDSNGPPPIGSFGSSHAKIIGIVGGDQNYVTGAHGTKTSGLVGGHNCFEGTSPNSKIAFIDISAGSDDNLVIPANLVSLTTTLYNSWNVRAHSISWGSSVADGTYGYESYLIDYMISRNPKLIIVIAGGNSGPTGLVATPATAKNPISVGAGKTVPWSSVGPTADGRRAPFMQADGVDVYGPMALYPLTPNHASFNVESGTSFSAPQVAGQILSYAASFKDRYADDPTIAQVKAYLLGNQNLNDMTVDFTPHTEFHMILPARGRYCFSVTSPSRVVISWIEPEVVSNPILLYNFNLEVYGVGTSASNRELFEYLDIPPTATSLDIRVTGGIDSHPIALYINSAAIYDPLCSTSTVFYSPPQALVSGAGNLEASMLLWFVIFMLF